MRCRRGSSDGEEGGDGSRGWKERSSASSAAVYGVEPVVCRGFLRFLWVVKKGGVEGQGAYSGSLSTSVTVAFRFVVVGFALVSSCLTSTPTSILFRVFGAFKVVEFAAPVALIVFVPSA